MLKYLYGVVYDALGNPSDALAVTHKRDSYQHVDMARDVQLMPFNGGFVDFDRKTGEMSNFHGESISCQVKTVDKDNPDIFALIKEWNAFELEFNAPSHPKVVLFLKEHIVLEVLPSYKNVKKIENQTQLQECIESCIETVGWY